MSTRTPVIARLSAKVLRLGLPLLALAALSCQDAEPGDHPGSAPSSEGAEVQTGELGLGCGCSSNPVGGLYATFKVGNESYRQHILNPTAINDALALWRGRSQKRIPVGPLTCQCRGWNCRWSWFVDPAKIQFAVAAVELCDGIPSYVEAHCSTFGANYCPWGAQLVELRDCRTNATCPIASRF